MMELLTEGRQHLPLGICYLVIGIVGCLGHLRLLSVFKRHANYYGHHSNTYLLHGSLAVANLGVVGGFPFTGLSYIAGKWLFGDLGCRLYACQGMIFGIASILSLTLMAGERYMALCKPDILNILERNHYFLAMGGCWAMSIYWAALPFWGFGKYMLEPSGVSCAINWHSTDADYQSYITMVSAWCFVLPYIVLGVSFAACYFRYDSRTVDDYRSDVLLTSPQLKMIPRRLAIMSLVAWTPYACLCLQFFIRDPTETSYLSASAAPLVAKLVTALVPFVYGLSSDSLFDELTNNRRQKTE